MTNTRRRRQTRTRSFGDPHVWAPDEHNQSVRLRKRMIALGRAANRAGRALGALRQAFAGLSVAVRASGIQ